MYLDAAGVVVLATQVVRVADNGFVLELQLDDGNLLRFTGTEAARLRVQLNVLLEEFLAWMRRSTMPAGETPRFGYTWSPTPDGAGSTLPTSTT